MTHHTTKGRKRKKKTTRLDRIEDAILATAFLIETGQWVDAYKFISNKLYPSHGKK